MAELVNLNQARKAKNRLSTRQKADENAAKFGLTKAQKAIDLATSEKAKRDLDGAKRE